MIFSYISITRRPGLTPLWDTASAEARITVLLTYTPKYHNFVVTLMTDKDHMTASSIRLPSGSNADAQTPARAAGKAARKFRPVMLSFFGRTGVYRA